MSHFIRKFIGNLSSTSQSTEFCFNSICVLVSSINNKACGIWRLMRNVVCTRAATNIFATVKSVELVNIFVLINRLGSNICLTMKYFLI